MYSRILHGNLLLSNGGFYSIVRSKVHSMETVSNEWVVGG